MGESAFYRHHGRLTGGVIGYVGSASFKPKNTGVKSCGAEKNSNTGNDLDAGLALSSISAAELGSRAARSKFVRFMNPHNLVLAYFIYVAFEVLMHVSVLGCLTRRAASWKLLIPKVSMLISPGYWIALNCKSFSPPNSSSKELRAQLISNFNLWNLIISGLLLLVVLSIRSEGYHVIDLATSVVAWRFISRSFEICIAFAKDITTPTRRSSLDNADRMKLAIRSYFEIFVYSAAFYSCVGKSFSGVGQPLLDALYVGTLTNVADVAKSLLVEPHWVFLQVFATLSLVVLSIAGYLGKVKSID